MAYSIFMAPIIADNNHYGYDLACGHSAVYELDSDCSIV